MNINPQPEPNSPLGFRALTRKDFPLLTKWLSEPHVERWWRHDPSPGGVEADFGASVDGSDPTKLSLVYEGSRPIGLVQSYRIGDNPDWRDTLGVVDPSDDAVGIDYLIGEPDATGRGLGTAMLRDFVDEIWTRYPKAPAIVVAVQQGNPASWRTLDKIGFRRIWAGPLQSDDPSDQGPSYVYEMTRPIADNTGKGEPKPASDVE